MTFISIDPGTSTCGVAIWDIDDVTLAINDISTLTITIDKNIYLENRIFILYKKLLDIMEEYRPYQLIHESGFMDRFRPHAYGPIYTTIYLIRLSYKTTYKNTDFRGIYQYSPKYVKAAVSTGTAGKDDMYDAINSIKELQPFLLDIESEHAIDAIAIGYTHLSNVRDMMELLIF